MMNRGEELSHTQSLQLIEEMIYKARNSYHESGTSALLWGGTIMVCSVVSFVNTWLQLKWLNQVWWLTLIALVPQIVISAREGKTQKFKSHTADAMSGIWISFGISIFLVSFYSNVVKAESTATLFLILYGIPTFATGYMHRFRLMIVGGVICWVGAIISVYVPYRIDVVLFFIAAFFAWFLPGLILRRDYLKQKNNV
jgi:hypothetical protein